jgi:Zn-dependent protease with chaperone function
MMMIKRYSLSFIFSLLGSFLGSCLGRFLGSEGTAIMSTQKWMLFFFVLLVGLSLIYRILLSKKRKGSRILFFFILLFLTSLCSLFRFFILDWIVAGLTTAVSTFIWNVSSESGEESRQLSLPALESESTSESIHTFRAGAENEATIYHRIRLLEGQQYFNVPPQLHPGDYERLVREHFDQAVNVDHFFQIWDRDRIEGLGK